MKKKTLFLLPVVLLSSCSIKYDYKKDFSILFIGNSFSDDTIEYMPLIAKDLGYDIRICNLYYPGCTLYQHYNFLDRETKSYTYRFYENNYWQSIDNVDGNQYIKNNKWDVISFQQGSPYSGDLESYNDLDPLIGLVKDINDDESTDFVWNMTWAYDSWYENENFAKYNYDTETMYKSIIKCVKEFVVKNDNIKTIIPSGTAIQNGRTSSYNQDFTRDGFHMSLDIGRYIVALMAIKTLTDADLSKVNYKPKIVSDEEKAIAIESVNNAFKHPLRVTKSRL